MWVCVCVCDRECVYCSVRSRPILICFSPFAVVAGATAVVVIMKRSTFSSNVQPGVYGGSRSSSSASLQGSYTLSAPPGSGSFFNRPQQHQQQQVDPNGNVYTNYGFSDEVHKATF